MAIDSIRRARPLLGTFVEIAGAGPAAKREAAIEAAFEVIALVHRLMSFHEPDSDVSRLNRAALSCAVRVHPWTYRVLQAALEFYRRSGGLFDVAIAPAMQRIGLLPRDADERPPADRAGSTSDAIVLGDDYAVRFRHPGLRIDLGGIAKGFAVDRALDVLKGHGLTHGLVNAGGDLAVFGAVPERVHIRNPNDARQVLCQVGILDAALASSGRSFRPHESAAVGTCAIVDPVNGCLAHAVAGATVRAGDCMTADALTKIVMLAGMRAGEVLARYRAAAFMVSESGNVFITPDWQDAVRPAA